MDSLPKVDGELIAARILAEQPTPTMLDRVCKVALAVIELQAKGLQVKAIEVFDDDAEVALLQIAQPADESVLESFETSLVTVPTSYAFKEGRYEPATVGATVRFRLHGCRVEWTSRRDA